MTTAVDNKDSEMDTRYSWVLVTVSTLSYMLFVGSLKSFGVLYVELLEHYGRGAGNTAWVSSVAIFMASASGPLANHLCVLYSFRRVMFVGGVLGSCGYLLSSFVPGIEWMYLSIGIVTGFGYGLLFSPTSAIINYYVKKRRALANGIVVSGGGIGSFILPHLYRMLINEYDLSGCFLVYSGIALHSCLAAALVRQPDILRENKRKIKQADKDATEAKDCKETISYTQNHVENSKHCKTIDNKDTDFKKENHCFSKLDLSVFRIPSFTVIAIACLLHQIAYGSVLLMLPSHVVSLGYDNTASDLVMSLGGAGEVLSRILFGWLGDKSCLQRKHLFALTIMISGISTIAISFLPWYSALIVFGIDFGTFASAFIGILPVIVIDIVGMERFPSALGKIHFIFALSYIIGPPMSGWLKDITGSWVLSFRLVGSLSILAGILVFLDPVIAKLLDCCRHQHIKKEELPE